MTNYQFTKLLRRSARATNKALLILSRAEEEYTRRYGSSPSDADDDQWISQMSGANGACNEIITAEDVEHGATEYAGLPPYLYVERPSSATGRERDSQMKTKHPNSKGAAKRTGEARFAAARGSAAYVVEYQAFDAEKRSFGWKELVRYKTRRLADMVVKINKRKCELRVRKIHE